MLLLSIIAIYSMRKDLAYNISLPEFRTVIKPIVLGLVVTTLLNAIITGAIKLAGAKDEMHPALLKMNWVQILIFVFIYASTTEELIFRGFLLNSLKSLKPI